MLHHIEDIFSHPPQPTAAGDEDTDDASHEWRNCNQLLCSVVIDVQTNINVASTINILIYTYIFSK
jgi:hypothetical protein